jgi:hypothetical protein
MNAITGSSVVSLWGWDFTVESGAFAILLNLVIVLGVLAVFMGLVVLLCRPLYYKMAAIGSEHTVLKARRSKPLKAHKPFGAFLIKEMTVVSRSISSVMRNYVLILIMPMILFALNRLFTALGPNLRGDKMIMAFNMLIALLCITSSNSNSANALSDEGREFAVLKTAPSDTSKIAWAKVLTDIVVSTLLISLSYVLLTTSDGISSKSLIPLLVVVLLVNWGHIFWSFQLDLRSPHFLAAASTGNSSDNPNIGKSIVVGLVVALLFFAVTLFFLLEENTVSTIATWIKIIVLAVAFLAARLLLFNENLKVYFREIEF